jgi:hypothetical protein
VAHALACFGDGKKSSGRAGCAALRFRDLLVSELPLIVLGSVVEDGSRDRLLLVVGKMREATTKTRKR